MIGTWNWLKRVNNLNQFCVLNYNFLILKDSLLENDKLDELLTTSSSKVETVKSSVNQKLLIETKKETESGPENSIVCTISWVC